MNDAATEPSNDGASEPEIAATTKRAPDFSEPGGASEVLAPGIYVRHGFSGNRRLFAHEHQIGHSGRPTSLDLAGIVEAFDGLHAALPEGGGDSLNCGSSAVAPAPGFGWGPVRGQVRRRFMGAGPDVPVSRASA